MRSGRSTGTPTKAQAKRWHRIREYGCIACHLREVKLPEEFVQPYPYGPDCDIEFCKGVPCEIHHQLVGGKHGQKRLGHDHTIGLCRFHHQGVMPPWFGMVNLGPSFKSQARRFREVFGQDDELLRQQNELLGAA